VLFAKNTNFVIQIFSYGCAETHYHYEGTPKLRKRYVALSNFLMKFIWQKCGYVHLKLLGHSFNTPVMWSKEDKENQAKGKTELTHYFKRSKIWDGNGGEYDRPAISCSFAWYTVANAFLRIF
jgi:hypothetical protein